MSAGQPTDADVARARALMAETRAETLSAYVRRTCGDCDGRGPDWLADEIQILEDALGWARARAVDAGGRLGGLDGGEDE